MSLQCWLVVKASLYAEIAKLTFRLVTMSIRVSQVSDNNTWSLGKDQASHPSVHLHKRAPMRYVSRTNISLGVTPEYLFRIAAIVAIVSQVLLNSWRSSIYCSNPADEPPLNSCNACSISFSRFIVPLVRTIRLSFDLSEVESMYLTWILKHAIHSAALKAYEVLSARDLFRLTAWIYFRGNFTP